MRLDVTIQVLGTVNVHHHFDNPLPVIVTEPAEEAALAAKLAAGREQLASAIDQSSPPAKPETPAGA